MPQCGVFDPTCRPTDPLLCAIGTHTDVFANTTPFKFLSGRINAYGTQLTLHRLGCYDMRRKASWYIEAPRSEWHAAARQAMHWRPAWHVADASFALVEDTCLVTESAESEESE